MHARQDPSASLVMLARMQAGIVTREQALATGLPRRSIQRLVDQGRWVAPAPGVYDTTPERSDFESTAWAGVLAAGDGAMLGEHAAGHQLKLCREVPKEVVVLVSQHIHRQEPAGVRFVRRRTLPKCRGLLPCADVEATVLDLCSAEPARTVEWVTTALREQLTTRGRLLTAVKARNRLPRGVRDKLLTLLADVEGLQSHLEHLFVTQVLDPHGLPHGERQYRAGRSGGRRDVRIGPVLIELDGRTGHSEPSDVFRDMDRDNEAVLEGLPTLHYGFHDCWERPCDVASQVSTALHLHGVESGAHPCPSCRPERD